VKQLKFFKMKIFTLTIRKFKKVNGAITFGVASLVVGLVCVMYIFLWITDEVSFDRFHSNIKRIFVVHAYLEGGSENVDFSGCPPAVALVLESEYPEVDKACRYFPPYVESLATFGENSFMEKLAYSDGSLFDIFSFPFIYGNKWESGAVSQIVLTETASKRYFGIANPVGKILRINNQMELTVAGVIRDIPHNSTIKFDMVVPLKNMSVFFGRNDFLNSWYNNAFVTFGLLKNESGYQKVSSTITRRIQKELPESKNFLRTYKFAEGYLYEQKHIRNVRIFGIIGLLVLIAAVLNFINLSTARSSKHAKETGLRKTIGASRMSIVRLIYSDMAIICLLSFLLAISFAFVGLSLFNNAIGKEISFLSLLSVVPLATLAGIYLFTVIFSGFYPAIYISSFSPIQTLNSNYQSIKSRGVFRNLLVITMFVISIALLSATLIIGQQTKYLQAMDLGFEKDQLMYVSLYGKQKEQSYALKEELERSSGIIACSIVDFLPTNIGNNGENWNWEGKAHDFKPLVTNWRVDEDFLKTFGATMQEGDFLSEDRDGIVINETFARMIGWNTFEGKFINNQQKSYQILGVINDIFFNSLSDEVKPMAIFMTNSRSKNYIVLKVNTANIKSTIELIKNSCQKFEPAFPFVYAFLDEEYNRQLSTELNMGNLIGLFSVFAMIVLCLGLLGLIMFLTEQRFKEIGLRKCMGETVFSITVRIIKPFLNAGLMACLISLPATWLAMNWWLEGYSNHIEIEGWVFLVSALFAIVVSVLTVLWQSWKAATRNPIEALRCE
jgi:putative ABC transport system permease protein